MNKYRILLFMISLCKATGFVCNPVVFQRGVSLKEKPDYETPNEDDDPDVLEKYSDWFGWFPREKKWKSVRFTVYSIISGYIIADVIQDVHELIISNQDSLSGLL